MLHVKAISKWSQLLRIRQFREVSGYKINEQNYPRKKLLSNYTDEEIFREQVSLCVLKKTKSPLRLFEKIDEKTLMRRAEGPNPNAQYMNRPDLPAYRSIQRYYKVAETERRRQRKYGVWWKTLDYWIKQNEGNQEFVNIGFPIPKKQQKNREDKTKGNPTFEKAARNRTSSLKYEASVVIEGSKLKFPPILILLQVKLRLDLNDVHHEWEQNASNSQQLQAIAHHYNVYQNLFKCGHFLPNMHMDVEYECDDETCNPVYYGNELLPSNVKNAPSVAYNGANDQLFTLLLTNPDEHLENNKSEYVHWLIGNIPGFELEKGETLVDYLRPFPARGTGFHRMIFILFQQNVKIDYTLEKREIPCFQLRDRDFSTFDFYRKYEDELTPVSLRFFQCKWDASVKNTYHNILKMREPVYEYAKLTEKKRLARLKRTPHKKTLHWLARFLPKEPVYPDGSAEEISLRRQAALDASSYIEKPNNRTHSMKNVY